MKFVLTIQPYTTLAPLAKADIDIDTGDEDATNDALTVAQHAVHWFNTSLPSYRFSDQRMSELYKAMEFLTANVDANQCAVIPVCEHGMYLRITLKIVRAPAVIVTNEAKTAAKEAYVAAQEVPDIDDNARAIAQALRDAGYEGEVPEPPKRGRPPTKPKGTTTQSLG